MAKAPLNKIEMAHQMYREGRYDDALGFYTEALSMAKTKGQEIALHSNRAACYLKLHDFNKAAEECTSVLELDQKHTGALMLRAQTLVTLKEYHSALFDVNRLMELNPSSEIYQNLQARLKTQLSLATIPESEAEIEEEEEEEKYEVESNRYEKQDIKKIAVTYCGKDDKVELKGSASATEVILPKTQSISELSEQEVEKKMEPRSTCPAEVTAKAENVKKPSDQHSKGWQAIPKPKGHSALDYARWDSVANDSSDDDNEDDDEEPLPQYRFRVRTVGVRQVK